MNARKLQALRNLAERPGTEAEGRLARELLARYEKKQASKSADDHFADYLRTGSLDDLAQAVGKRLCDCGSRVKPFGKCYNFRKHAEIRRERETRFPVGTRVYYNRWAYTPNCPGTVVGYSRGDDSWNWIRIQFDHLKNPRSVPVYSQHGWHISTEPLSPDAMKPLRDGMEKFATEAQ